MSIVIGCFWSLQVSHPAFTYLVYVMDLCEVLVILEGLLLVCISCVRTVCTFLRSCFIV